MHYEKDGKLTYCVLGAVVYAVLSEKYLCVDYLCVSHKKLEEYDKKFKTALFVTCQVLDWPICCCT